MILRKATHCCHFHSATRRLRTADDSTATGGTAYTVRAYILTGTLTQTCTARLALHETLFRFVPIRPTHYFARTTKTFLKKNRTRGFFSALANEHFFRSQVSHRDSQSTPVDSVTLKINKVIRRRPLPLPWSIQQHYTRRNRTKKKFRNRRRSRRSNRAWRHNTRMHTTTYVSHTLFP